MKILLIDGNNFAFRSAFGKTSDLTHNGQPTGLLFGFFRNYFSLLDNHPADVSVICWDAGYNRRMDESQKAVEAGLIPTTYKQARCERAQASDEEEKQKHREIMDQIRILKDIIEHTTIIQASIKGAEADDVAASYVERYKEGNTILIITSDEDYHQLISDNVSIFDPIKKRSMDMDKFRQKYGISPEQWVDLGAIVGDAGDGIIGCDGIGPKKGLELIQQHKTIDGVQTYCRSLAESLREDFPDSLGPAGLPYSGIRVALEDESNKALKKLPFKKVLLNVLEQDEKIRLAYSLKRMDSFLDIPEIKKKQNTNTAAVEAFFNDHGIRSLRSRAKELTEYPELDADGVRRAVRAVKGNIGSKNIYKCPTCKQEFMSQREVKRCPNCNTSLDCGETAGNAQPVQGTLF